MIVYTACPCCNSNNIVKALFAKDHTVTNEIFEIGQCNDCTARFTQNAPDKTDIIKYYKSENYISHSDTKKGFINSIYHQVRKTTLNSKKRLIKKCTKLSNGKVLDIGAGTGAFLHTMNNAGWGITGLEPDESAREKGKKLYGLNLQPSVELFNLSPQTFDAITLWHVLEHVHELHEYIVQLKKLLKPNGYLFIAVPNYTSYDAGVYKEFWAGYDVPRHLYHFSPHSIIQLLLLHGLKIKEIKPMWYDSFYVSLLSEKYRTGNNNFINACVNGFISNWKTLFNKKRCSSLIYVATH
ncbi:MAG TPA: class I SAM-dependent methyltransferase [Chitinophagaceae bacterium]|nr:class I SAM-dependent methyltransferase [Chitinophagaceae bacterium]